MAYGNEGERRRGESRGVRVSGSAGQHVALNGAHLELRNGQAVAADVEGAEDLADEAWALADKILVQALEHKLKERLGARCSQKLVNLRVQGLKLPVVAELLHRHHKVQRPRALR